MRDDRNDQNERERLARGEVQITEDERRAEADLARAEADGGTVRQRFPRTGTEPELRDVQRRMNRAGSQPGDTGLASWQDIKGRFVDDPAGAIAEAEALVQRAVEDRIRALRDEAAALCADGDGTDEAGATENLRTRLLRYQQYCERLAGTSIH